MKKSMIVTLCLMMAAALSSCEKFLTSHPVDFLDPNGYYNNLKSVEAGLMGIYSPMASRGSGSGAGYTIYGEIVLPLILTTSDLDYYSTSSATYFASIFNFTPSDAYVNEYWRALYIGISRANAFIEAIEPAQISGLSDEYKNVVLGEAYFLRGFYYWHLAANFGGVPLRTTYNPELLHVKRASLMETYGQILSDMNKADSMVYEADRLNLPGRVTKTTVQAMLARVSLYMAGEPLRDTEKYREAAEWARKVKQSDLHRLNPSYEDVFTRLIQERYDLDYRESMWEVEFMGANSPRTNGRWGMVNGVSCSDPDIGLGSGVIQVSNLMENYYREDANDTRYAWSVCPYVWTGNPGVKTDRSFGNRPIGKYRKEAILPGTEQTTNHCGTNFPIMRYADVLLVLAEAANEIDEPDEAMSALNEVRRRAGAQECTHTSEPGKIPLTSKEDFREFIKKERARELCFEATRRLDLVRWGHLVESVQAMSLIATQSNARRAGNNIGDRHKLLPIPSSEMNVNNLMVQNPGW